MKYYKFKITYKDSMHSHTVLSKIVNAPDSLSAIFKLVDMTNNQIHIIKSELVKWRKKVHHS